MPVCRRPAALPSERKINDFLQQNPNVNGGVGDGLGKAGGTSGVSRDAKLIYLSADA
jgi:hypothetical protein